MVSKVWLAATRGSKSNDLLCCARCALRSSWSVDFLAICANCCCKAVAMVPIDVAWVSPTVSSRASLTQWLATLRVVEFGRRQRCCLGFCLLLLVPSSLPKSSTFCQKLAVLGTRIPEGGEFEQRRRFRFQPPEPRQPIHIIIPHVCAVPRSAQVLEFPCKEAWSTRTAVITFNNSQTPTECRT